MPQTSGSPQSLPEGPDSNLRLADPGPRIEDGGDSSFNTVQAHIGGLQAWIRWRPSSKPGGVREDVPAAASSRQRRWPRVAGLLAFFILGVIAALGVAWELVPYVETTRVVGELARLKLGGPLCVLGGLTLYLVRRLLHRS